METQRPGRIELAGLAVHSCLPGISSGREWGRSASPAVRPAVRVGAGDGHVPSPLQHLFCAFCFCVCTSQVLDAMMCRAACGVRIATSPSQHHRCQPLDTLAGLPVSLQQGSAEPFQLSTSSYPSRLTRNEGLPEDVTPYEGRAAFRADEFIAGPSLHLFCNWLLHCAIASIARISDRPLSSVRRLASSQR